MTWHVRVIPNRYADSVRLMAIARAIRERDGVARCEIGMGTPANLEMLAGLGAKADASPGDVVIAVEAEGGAATETLAHAEQRLSALESEDRDGAVVRQLPRSLELAARELDGANVALISVPGEYATLEAHRALSAGMHVFLFSDHVSLDAEIELKRRGAELGLLVMGPECGTAMLGGIGLGFANVVRPGSVGIVAAAGTGAQETACLLDAAGVGVSHVVGVGGRDLSHEVGGIMFCEAMRLLAADDSTETLLLVSKPPAADAVRALSQAIPDDVRVVAAFVGSREVQAPCAVHPTLEAGAAAAANIPPVEASGLEQLISERKPDVAGRPLLGLYSGGSLAHEAVTILEPTLGPIAGNVGHGADKPNGGHALFDLGESEYTRGRPHPMVDLDSRIRMLRDATAAQHTGCVLLDVVLGYSAHPDPATGLAETVSNAAEDALVIAHVCGTADDPQDARRQEGILIDAGAVVAPSNAAAARLALHALT